MASRSGRNARVLFFWGERERGGEGGEQGTLNPTGTLPPSLPLFRVLLWEWLRLCHAVSLIT